MSVRTTIEIDIETFKNGTYDAYISHEGSSGASYKKINARQIGEYTADLIDTLEEADSGESFCKQRAVLIASNGKTIDTTVYEDIADAESALRNIINHHIEPGFDIEAADASFINKHNAYLSPSDKFVKLKEDWIWEIIKI